MSERGLDVNFAWIKAMGEEILSMQSTPNFC